MWSSRNGAPQWVRALVQRAQVRAQVRAERRFCPRGLPFLLLLTSVLPFPDISVAQDAGSAEREFHGKGVEITVTVHDPSGDVLAAPAVVKVYRDGSIPSGEAETSRGTATLVVNSVGEFTIAVKAPGYGEVHEDLSVIASGRTQVDVYLHSNSSTADASSASKPILAPKASEALNKGLQALSEEKLGEAQKYLGRALQLAPAHPDVLYLQGLVFLKQREWAQAQTALKKATQMDPSHGAAFAALGMALCDQGNYAGAISPLERSLQLEKPASEAAAGWQTRWALAKAYYHEGRYEEALQTSQLALVLSRGKAPQTALLVAQALTAVGRYDDAAQTLRDFLRDHGQQPEAATAQRWLNNLAESGKIQVQTARQP
jgi:thioredoxin-like negative regulator of GroEL